MLYVPSQTTTHEDTSAVVCDINDCSTCTKQSCLGQRLREITGDRLTCVVGLNDLCTLTSNAHDLMYTVPSTHGHVRWPFVRTDFKVYLLIYSF